MEGWKRESNESCKGDQLEGAEPSLCRLRELWLPPVSVAASGPGCVLAPMRQPDISRHILYTHSARKWGRQASTGALMSVAMHAGLPYAAR